jgi:dihydrolipoamide dehydrogenase
MYDIIIMGAGPGGYIAAERAGAKKKSVLLIEKEHLGGTCLNVGCIPTKTLLNSAKLYRHALDGASFGVHVEEAKFNLAEAMKWKDEVIEKLRGGIDFQMKKFKVEVVTGTAEFVDRNTVRLKEDPARIFQGSNIIVATGSSPAVPPIPGANNPAVRDSTGMLSIDFIPKHLVVIGGGVIGLEFASFFATIGSKVSVVEMMDEIIPFMDRQLAPQLRRAIKGIEYHLGAKVEKLEGSTVFFSKDQKKEKLEGDCVLMAVGRKPNLDGLGLEKIGIDMTRWGIKVDEHMRTNVPGVYAIGDVTGMSLLAHSASRMGEVAVDNICGGKDRMRYDAIPWVVYTNPEASGVGLTEDEAKKRGISYKVAQMPLRANGRFLAENGATAPGVCKIIVNADTDVILGVHLMGGVNSEMIFGASAFIENEMRAVDVRQVVFPHPSVSEIIRDTLWEIA